ncbi:MAG: hypothetical protein QM724_06820 [Flavobacteriales bacterium]
MRWQLDDNERGAFHYLFGGALFMLAVRLLFQAVDHFPSGPPEAEGLAAFQHGYLLGHQGLIVVATAAGRLERIAFAALFSLAAAVVCGGIVALIARRIGVALIVVRIVLALVFGWSAYAALFVPVRSTRVEDRSLITRSYGIAIRDIPLPFTATEQRSSPADVARIEAVDTDPVRGCDGRVMLQCVDQTGTPALLGIRTGLCINEQLEALRQASDLAATLERDLH